MKERVSVRVGGVVVLVLLLAAFVAGPDKVGRPAPPLQGTTLDGDSVDLADFKGKVVLIDFWASWCGPCRQELPFLSELYRSKRDFGLEVIAVNVDDDPAHARDFLSALDHAVAFPVVADPEKKLPPVYDIAAMPTSVLVDRDGVVRYWHDGFKPSYEATYREEIAALLNEKRTNEKRTNEK